MLRAENARYTSVAPFTHARAENTIVPWHRHFSLHFTCPARRSAAPTPRALPSGGRAFRDLSFSFATTRREAQRGGARPPGMPSQRRVGHVERSSMDCGCLTVTAGRRLRVVATAAATMATTQRRVVRGRHARGQPKDAARARAVRPRAGAREEKAAAPQQEQAGRGDDRRSRGGANRCGSTHARE